MDFSRRAQRVLLLSLLLTLGNFVYAQMEEEEAEFAEAIFFDTSTDLGAESGALELNFLPGVQGRTAGNLYSAGFELEYVLFRNFGVELEPIFYFGPQENGEWQQGIGDLEIETQYTFLFRENIGLAGGLEFQLPTGNVALGFGEGEFEVEPFVYFVYRTAFRLSFHPRLSLGIEPESGEIGTTATTAILYTIDDFMLGTEVTWFGGEDHMFLLAPQMGVDLGPWFLGGGVRIPHDTMEAGNRWEVVGRIIYELD